MFDIGFAELLIIAVVGLVVLGPEKLPVAARTVGLWVRKAKRTIGGIQSEINEELRLEEMKRQVVLKQDELDRELDEMREPFSEALGNNSPLANSISAPEKKKSEPSPDQTAAVETPPVEENSKADDRS
ncbi:Sec-independent protein translocase protein TatB [Amphritea japonica]|uniref:Sec-independent protein translocase protein TatB n=1 Tax=Amphritea japonica ATCC BAA-1530 TaxID=1278309 RepID=A0A7R6PEB6_9GAMM|nr:Sec-independent protein translocase protein TatB [Amphritea japonica]BBB27893.1 sec-independent protein translocase protein TatB [Amphritea japonica ATCC BAA-1530]